MRIDDEVSIERGLNMKKMRIGLILIAVILIVLGWSAHKQKEEKQQINKIINEQQDVNQIEVKNNKLDKVIFSTEHEEEQYKEYYPLSHIEKLEKADRKLFENDPDYTIIYKVDGKELYSVEILRLKNNDVAISEELQPFLFQIKGHTYVIYWPDQNKILQQSKNTQKLLRHL